MNRPARRLKCYWHNFAKEQPKEGAHIVVASFYGGRSLEYLALRSKFVGGRFMERDVDGVYREFDPVLYPDHSRIFWMTSSEFWEVMERVKRVRL